MARLLCSVGVVLAFLVMAAPASAAPPPNDSFATPTPLTGSTATASGTNVEATKENGAGEPQHANDPGGASVWYSWTAPSNGNYRIDTCDSDFDTLLAVYTGTSVGSLSSWALNDQGAHCADASQLVLQAVGGLTYRIAVDGWSDGGDEPADTGSIGLSLAPEPPPANDNSSTAEVLPSSSDLVVEGDNFGATKEGLEPDHAGDPGGASVWYRWTAPFSGTASIFACDFDSMVAVYTSGLFAPAEVASDFCGVEFQAVSGTHYRIAVDGFSDDGAHPPAQDFFLLFLELVPPPAKAAIPQPGQPADNKAPQSKIKDVIVNSEQDKATIRFGSSEQGSKFRCKLDGKPFRSCKSPKTYRNLDEGKHKVKVQARDAAGNLDNSPAVRRFEIE